MVRRPLAKNRMGLSVTGGSFCLTTQKEISRKRAAEAVPMTANKKSHAKKKGFNLERPDQGE